MCAGAAGVAAGFERADAFAGLLISFVIVGILVSAVKDVYHRLMDAVSPELVEQAQSALIEVEGVEGIDDIKLR